MSKKKSLFFGGALIILALSFATFMYFYTNSSSELTLKMKEELLANFSPIRLLLYSMAGFSIAILADKYFRQIISYKDENLTKIVRFFSMLGIVLLGVLVMSINTFMYYTIPVLSFVSAILLVWFIK